jgi:hypothetical protein
MSRHRIMEFYLIDLNESIPIEKSIIYHGERRVTDKTDEEIWIEIGVDEILKKYNEYRVTVVNKHLSENSGRDVYLEPIEFRDVIRRVVQYSDMMTVRE